MEGLGILNIHDQHCNQIEPEGYASLHLSSQASKMELGPIVTLQKAARAFCYGFRSAGTTGLLKSSLGLATGLVDDGPVHDYQLKTWYFAG